MSQVLARLGRRPVRRPAVALAAMVALAGGGIVALDAGGAQAAVPTAGYGFVIGNQPFAANYIPNQSFSGNSTGGINSIHRPGPGRWVVTMPGLGVAGGGGSVQVSSQDFGGRCKVFDWATVGVDVKIHVFCHTEAGVPADIGYSVSYHHDAGARAFDTGYVYANDSASASYTPPARYRYNSRLGISTVTRTGQGHYRVTFPGFNPMSGNVQVTAVGSDSRYCKVFSWGNASADINCFTATGAAADSKFTVQYSKNSTPTQPAMNKGAYAWVNQPANTNWYAPPASLSFSTGGAIRARQISVGSYEVKLVNMPAINDVNVIVTAQGSSTAHCNTTGISASGGDALLSVRCFGPTGFHVDSTFTIQYTTNRSNIGVAAA